MINPDINDTADKAVAFVVRVRADDLVNLRVLVGEQSTPWLTAIHPPAPAPSPEDPAANYPDTPTRSPRARWPAWPSAERTAAGR